MAVIKSFRHKGLRDYFISESFRGIQAKHAFRLKIQLSQLNIAETPEEMRVSGWDLHPLQGELAGHWSIKVSGNWRLTFRFEGADAILVNYQDYH